MNQNRAIWVSYTDDMSAYEIAEKAISSTIDTMIRIIKGLPPVAQPEPKKGKWIFGFNNQYLEKYYYCSNCGCRKYTGDEPSDYFCSNCGADMRGGEKE